MIAALKRLFKKDPDGPQAYEIHVKEQGQNVWPIFAAGLKGKALPEKSMRFGVVISTVATPAEVRAMMEKGTCFRGFPAKLQEELRGGSMKMTLEELRQWLQQ